MTPDPLTRHLALALAKADRRLTAWRARAALWLVADESRGRLSWSEPPELAPGIRWELGAKGQLRVGRGCRIGPDAHFKVDGHLAFGDEVLIGPRCTISVLEGVLLGPGCLIAEHVSIRDHDHRYRARDLPVARQGYRIAPVRIGADVWLGAGVVVMPGVTLGDGCVVGAHSVVTRSFEEGSLLVGAPARMIGRRGESS